MEEVEVEGDAKSHPLFEVSGSGGEQEVDGASAAEPHFHGSDLMRGLIFGF